MFPICYKIMFILPYFLFLKLMYIRLGTLFVIKYIITTNISIKHYLLNTTTHWHITLHTTSNLHNSQIHNSKIIKQHTFLQTQKPVYSWTNNKCDSYCLSITHKEAQKVLLTCTVVSSNQCITILHNSKIILCGKNYINLTQMNNNSYKLENSLTNSYYKNHSQCILLSAYKYKFKYVMCAIKINVILINIIYKMIGTNSLFISILYVFSFSKYAIFCNYSYIIHIFFSLVRGQSQCSHFYSIFIIHIYHQQVLLKSCVDNCVICQFKYILHDKYAHLKIFFIENYIYLCYIIKFKIHFVIVKKNPLIIINIKGLCLFIYIYKILIKSFVNVYRLYGQLFDSGLISGFSILVSVYNIYDNNIQNGSQCRFL